MERKIALFHSNMKPLQTLAGQALHSTAEQHPHHHRTAIIVDFRLNFKKAAKKYRTLSKDLELKFKSSLQSTHISSHLIEAPVAIHSDISIGF